MKDGNPDNHMDSEPRDRRTKVVLHFTAITSKADEQVTSITEIPIVKIVKTAIRPSTAKRLHRSESQEDHIHGRGIQDWPTYRPKLANTNA